MPQLATLFTVSLPLCAPVFFNFLQFCSPLIYLVTFSLTPSKVRVQKAKFYKNDRSFEDSVGKVNNSRAEQSQAATCSVKGLRRCSLLRR